MHVFTCDVLVFTRVIWYYGGGDLRATMDTMWQSKNKKIGGR